MNGNVLMSVCSWCGETYIKDSIGQLHNCSEQLAKMATPSRERPEMPEDGEVVNLLKRR